MSDRELVRAGAMARDALSGLSDSQRVHFAVSLVQGVTDPNAAGSVAFAARLMASHSDILIREAYERESR